MTAISIDSRSVPVRKALWAGRISTTLVALFLLMDSTMKVFGARAAVEGTVRLGYPTSAILGIGIVELVCLAIYLVPRTAILGAVLLTGYLGGAVATHVRIGSPLFSHTLFPIYEAVFLWAGLALRDRRVRHLLHS